MSGGGGGIIIIRSAMKTALADPLVHGNLPDYLQTSIASALGKDVNDWTDGEHHHCAHAFHWAATHC